MAPFHVEHFEHCGRSVLRCRALAHAELLLDRESVAVLVVHVEAVSCYEGTQDHLDAVESSENSVRDNSRTVLVGFDKLSNPQEDSFRVRAAKEGQLPWVSLSGEQSLAHLKENSLRDCTCRGGCGRVSLKASDDKRIEILRMRLSSTSGEVSLHVDL